MATAEPADARPARPAFYNDPKIRGIFYQLMLFAVVVWLGYEFVINARDNLRAAKIATGLGFLDNTAGFSINQTLIPYTESDTYGRVFVVGLLNTLLVAAIGIVLATILGFVVGISRLSSNWLLQRLAGGYVELIRNLPLLFQILFWYLAVLVVLPNPRQSVSLFDTVFLNNRGLIVPRPVGEPGFEPFVFALLLAVLGSIALAVYLLCVQLLPRDTVVAPQVPLYEQIKTAIFFLSVLFLLYLMGWVGMGELRAALYTATFMFVLLAATFFFA